jgi:hypothetical protein
LLKASVLSSQYQTDKKAHKQTTSSLYKPFSIADINRVSD